ncbi:carbonyl reductase [Fusarium agapanthi]|uniref:Carbonyl reductase n=1 Tax=Fusarium agapanthi TaxID=1803897 RepID=A0A9P5BI35_9HYPO|nr:carbonyl reductase [Fusarium agapanthi]
MLVDGKYEQHMVANYMEPFILVNCLLPLLIAAAKDSYSDARIVNLGSIAMNSMLPASFKFNFDSPTCFKDPVPSYPWQWRYLGRFMFGFDMIRYAVLKIAVVLLIKELQERLEQQNLPISCIAVHPGEVLTEGVLALNNVLIRTIARMSFLTAEQGATDSLFAATATEVKKDALKYKGRFIVPVGKVAEPNPVAKDDRQVKGLWKNTVVEVIKWLAEKKLPILEAD